MGCPSRFRRLGWPRDGAGVSQAVAPGANAEGGSRPLSAPVAAPCRPAGPGPGRSSRPVECAEQDPAHRAPSEPVAQRAERRACPVPERTRASAFRSPRCGPVRDGLGPPPRPCGLASSPLRTLAERRQSCRTSPGIEPDDAPSGPRAGAERTRRPLLVLFGAGPCGARPWAGSPASGRPTSGLSKTIPHHRGRRSPNPRPAGSVAPAPRSAFPCRRGSGGATSGTVRIRNSSTEIKPVAVPLRWRLERILPSRPRPYDGAWPGPHPLNPSRDTAMETAPARGLSPASLGLGRVGQDGEPRVACGAGGRLARRAGGGPTAATGKGTKPTPLYRTKIDALPLCAWNSALRAYSPVARGDALVVFPNVCGEIEPLGSARSEAS